MINAAVIDRSPNLRMYLPLSFPRLNYPEETFVMTRSMLNHAVARRTGESLATIAILGFGPLVEDLPAPDAGPRHLGLDCPGCGLAILLTDAGMLSLPIEAECPRCDAAYPYVYAE